LEQPRRSTLADHVHRPSQLGPWVLINESWYKAPLGWVLSRATQRQFPDLLGECGNDDQLHELEHALGKQALQHDAERQ
jgi:hypothetical protein